MVDDITAPCLPEHGFVREATVRKFFPVSRTALWEQVKAGQFPAPFNIGPKTTAWPVEVLRSHFITLSSAGALSKDGGRNHG
jgi:prophage regulatory protein